MTSSLFTDVWTEEADPGLHRSATALFNGAGASNVHAHLGDSQGCLAHLSQEVCEDAVFFLDAHYSDGITSKQYGACPVLDEVDLVLSRAPGALIIIDDLREMTGARGYPSIAQVLGAIPSWCRAEVAFDQLIIRGGATWD
jgi:hypothetical protein